MGLDMSLSGRKMLNTYGDNPRKEDGFPIGDVILDLGYWRKHPNLHGYIVQEFAEGVDECQRIDLEADDLRLIIAAVRANKLPHTEGFFFGSSDWWAGREDEAVKPFEDAIKWLETDPGKGEFMRSVYYQASW
jgi:hypothetical protein